MLNLLFFPLQIYLSRQVNVRTLQTFLYALNRVNFKFTLYFTTVKFECTWFSIIFYISLHWITYQYTFTENHLGFAYSISISYNRTYNRRESRFTILKAIMTKINTHVGLCDVPAEENCINNLDIRNSLKTATSSDF